MGQGPTSAFSFDWNPDSITVSTNNTTVRTIAAGEYARVSYFSSNDNTGTLDFDGIVHVNGTSSDTGAVSGDVWVPTGTTLDTTIADAQDNYIIQVFTA